MLKGQPKGNRKRAWTAALATMAGVALIVMAGCKNRENAGTSEPAEQTKEPAPVKAPAPVNREPAPAAPAAAPKPQEGKPVTIANPDQLTVDDMKKLQAVIETNQGVIKFKFYPEQAPLTCRNFIKLASKGFYNNLIFHRVIQGFMIQGGDPQGTGTGGPGWNVKAEFSNIPHVPGTVSMARAQDPNSAGSQFFICLEKKSFLDGQYTAFGQVTSGQDVVEKIGATPTGAQDRPREPQTMLKVYIEAIP